ncbi:protein N-lysine methyltransferase METTL21D-like [Dermacentor silvarum]|uniref:protein N-lysine methyltransferase METTL21D-like n=1 Tax=Dermacentor silvarum TaxID=543639 RepID=UPI00189BA170|nr:protein N-lysine methyltransferase METTL21D-like [Dermacentor silvarum]
MNASTFVRTVHLDSTDVELAIHQWTEGDVGCVVWDGALVLGKYIDHKNCVGEWDAKKSVLELGSGTGIVGIITASFGNDVLLTDLPQFVPLLEKNLEENRDRLRGKASVGTLEWGAPPAPDMIAPDVMLISECVYYEKAVEPLLKTMTELCGPNTEMLVSYEDRDNEANSAAVGHFLRGCRQHFLIEEVPSKEQHPDFSSHDIHILKLRPIKQ